MRGKAAPAPEPRLGAAIPDYAPVPVWSRIARALRPHRRAAVGSLGLMLLGVGLGVTGPYLFGLGVEALGGEVGRALGGRAAQAGNWWFWMLLFGGVQLAAAIVAGGTAALTGWLGQRVVLDLRARLFRHITAQRMRFHHAHPVGWLLTRLTGDVEQVRELFGQDLARLLTELVTLTGLLAIMFVLSWQLTLWCILTLPPLIVAVEVFRRYSRRFYRVVRRENAVANTYVHEHLSGMEVVQAFAQEQTVRAGYATQNEKLYQAHRRTVLTFSGLLWTVDGLTHLAKGVLIIATGWLMFELQISAIVVGTTFLMYLQKLFDPIRGLSERWTNIQNALASLEKIFQVLGTDQAFDAPADARTTPVREATLVFRDVGFAYRSGEPVLQGVSCTIRPGERVALVGATGAGKTTTIALAQRLYDPQSGAITLDDTDLRAWDPQALRQSFGVVLQDPYLFNDTVAANIAFGQPGVGRAEVMRAAELVGAADFIAQLPQGYDTEVGERGDRLSTGQKQLLALARAVVAQPPLLILDEATSNIDAVSEQLIQRAIERILTGRTALIVAHRLTTVMAADRVLVFRHGRIIEQGPPAELLARPSSAFRRLYDKQFRAPA